MSPEALDAEVSALATLIASKSSAAIASGKQVFYRQLEMPLGEAYDVAGHSIACDFFTEDGKEGVDAFLGKRAARWKDPASVWLDFPFQSTPQYPTSTTATGWRKFQKNARQQEHTPSSEGVNRQPPLDKQCHNDRSHIQNTLTNTQTTSRTTTSRGVTVSVRPSP